MQKKVNYNKCQMIQNAETCGTNICINVHQLRNTDTVPIMLYYGIEELSTVIGTAKGLKAFHR